MSERRTPRVLCCFLWDDEVADDHCCHLLYGHSGLHECGEDDECEATAEA